ncbi:Lrp/AsnC family transcriptional regulator [Candidatus Micrarchaeota archaeon]|nr:Lrp/AsnC family transcriptional regulator [Candidatus Micrarchaeota archaeon]
MIDETDKRIIEALSEDSRESFRKLARKVRVSPATVIQRVKRMEKEGVIRGYSAVLDFEKLGFDFEAVIEVTIRKGALLEVQEKIAQMPGVASVFDVTGESDSLVVARCRSRKEFSRLVKKILSIQDVERTNTHVILNVVKDKY